MTAEREAAARSDTVWRAVGLAAPALLVLLLLLLTLTKGLGYRLGGGRETSMEIPDDLPPALVAMLWESGDFVRRAVPATLLDLVQRDVLTLEPVPPGEPSHDRDKPGYRFSLTGRHAKEMTGYEHALVSLLFRDAVNDGPVSIARLREYAKKDPEQVGSRLRQFHSQALEKDRWGLTAEPVTSWVKTVRVLSIPAGVIGLIAAADAGSAWLLLGVPVAIAVAWVAPRLLRRPSDVGIEKFRAYRRLRNYMRAADGMDWKPPTAVVVWERYLVLAVVFGLADRVLKALAVKAPAVVADPAFPTALWLGDTAGISAWASLNEGWGHVYAPRMMQVPTTSYTGPGVGGHDAGGSFSGGLGGFSGGPRRRGRVLRRRRGRGAAAVAVAAPAEPARDAGASARRMPLPPPPAGEGRTRRSRQIPPEQRGRRDHDRQCGQRCGEVDEQHRRVARPQHVQAEPLEHREQQLLGDEDEEAEGQEHGDPPPAPERPQVGLVAQPHGRDGQAHRAPCAGCAPRTRSRRAGAP